MPQMPDISTYTFQELTDLQSAIQARIASMQQEDAPKLLEEFAKRASTIGLSVEQLVNGTGRKRRKRRRAFGLFRRKQPTPPLQPEVLTPPAAQGE